MLAALQSPLYAHIFAIVRNRENAEDVLQETLFTIARKLGTLSDPRWVKPWAYRIANRRAVKKSQGSSREEALRSDTPLESLASPEEPPGLSAEEVGKLRKEVESLSPRNSVVLRMHYLEEMTFRDIAEALELPVGTIKSRLAYGLAALRRVSPRVD